MYQYNFISTEPSKLIGSHSQSRLDTKEKLENYHKEKQSKIRKLEIEMMNENGYTFKPKLNENSLNSINDSLIKRNEEFLRNRDIKLKSYVRTEELECTFSPKIISQYPTSGDQEDLPVDQRLFNYDQIYRQKKESFKENFKESYAFKPEINKNTDEILRKKKELLEVIKENFDRKKEKAKENSQNESNDTNNEDYMIDQKKRIKWKNEINLITEKNIAEDPDESLDPIDNSNDLKSNSNFQSNRKELETPKLNNEFKCTGDMYIKLNLGN